MLETIETSRNASEQLETRIATLQQTYEYEVNCTHHTHSVSY